MDTDTCNKLETGSCVFKDMQFYVFKHKVSPQVFKVK